MCKILIKNDDSGGSATVEKVRTPELPYKKGTTGRNFAVKTIDFDVVTLAPNIAHVHSHSGTPKRRVPHNTNIGG